ncbi:MAG: hypothetical protein ACKPKO_08205, partial [Candidatus Fonsibacter sp.]
MLRDKRVAERYMWAHREPIWGTMAPLPAGADALLASYFASRSVSMPRTPTIRMARIRGAIQAAYGSAPGSDGIPYKVYHGRVAFVAELLAEGLAAAEDGPDGLRRILGEPEDLLIWIPKPGMPRGPSALRPLQHPTCLRRLFGTVITDLIGRDIEPLLSQEQAAKKGGDV